FLPLQPISITKGENMKVSVGIWGCGNVGNATARVFEDLCPALVKVYKYDIDPSKSNASPDRVVECDFIFLCLPTPMKITGEISLEYLESALKEIRKLAKHSGENRKIIIIRSTTVSGSTDKFASEYTEFDFAFCPEFLREAHAVIDALNPGRIVIGTNDDRTSKLVEALFILAFAPKVRYVHLTRIEAETLKYFANTHRFVQVLLSNELFFFCQKIGVDYERVQEILSLDEVIGKFTNVPGHDGDFGAGGRCLPKDTSALAYIARTKDSPLLILEKAIEVNDKVRINKDWFQIKGAVESYKY
ncbi:MAG: hypothetical protein ABIE94_05910, partial [archaeon]